VPGAFLTVADNPIYRVYNHDVRLWDFSAVADQQTAGLIMKLGGGFYIWALIAFLFFRWVSSNAPTLRPDASHVVRAGDLAGAPEAGDVLDVETSDLTFEDVQSAFSQAGEPISE